MQRVGFLRRDVPLHLMTAFLVCCCAAATWWQLGRALGGNGLSWAYTFEWPFFAACAVYMWWKLWREGPPEAATPVPEHQPDTTEDGVTTRRPARAPRRGPAVRPCPDEEVTGPRRSGPGRVLPALTEEEAERWAAYNRYLAALAASDEPKRLVVRKRRSPT